MSAATLERPAVDVAAFTEGYWRIIAGTGRSTETRMENAIRWMLVESAVEGEWCIPHPVTLAKVAAVRGPGMPEDGDAAAKAGQSGRILIADNLAALPLNENSVPAAMLLFVRAVRRTRSTAKAQPIWQWEDPETPWVTGVAGATTHRDGDLVSWGTLLSWISTEAGDVPAHVDPWAQPAPRGRTDSRTTPRILASKTPEQAVKTTPRPRFTSAPRTLHIERDVDTKAWATLAVDPANEVVDDPCGRTVVATLVAGGTRRAYVVTKV